MKETKIAEKVWEKLFPLKMGDRVRVTHACLRTRSKDDSMFPVKVGMIGKVTRVPISRKWKELMVSKFKCYPAIVLKEIMVGVTFPERQGITTAFRMKELEKVGEDEK